MFKDPGGPFKYMFTAFRIVAASAKLCCPRVNEGLGCMSDERKDTRDVANERIIEAQKPGCRSQQLELS